MHSIEPKYANIILDTNVIVSAFLSSKEDASTVLVLKKLYKHEINMFYSSEILVEYKDVLNRDKFQFDKLEIKKFIEFVIQNCYKEEAIHLIEQIPDEKDRPFYELVEFLQNKKAILVTGNIKHFPHKDYIMTPNDYIKLCN